MNYQKKKKRKKGRKPQKNNSMKSGMKCMNRRIYLPKRFKFKFKFKPEIPKVKNLRNERKNSKGNI